MGEAWESTDKDFTIDKQIRQLHYSILMMQSAGGLSLAQREVIAIESRVQTEMIAELEAKGGHREELHSEPIRPHTGGRGAWNGKRGL